MSDHIPDLTKMISDTPRTESFNCYDSGCDDPLHAWGAFSAELERELNAANGNVERLTKANLQLREGCEELKQRIKRLEDAGDAMATYAHIIDFKNWEEAKEAKP